MATAVLLVTSIGLISRSEVSPFPAGWGKYPGDALWATMVLFCLGFVRPTTASLKLATAALLVSYTVEFSQLYQAPWANVVRSTLVGHLILGAGFDWIDLGAYAIGVAIGFIVDVRFLFRVRHVD